MSTNPSKAPPEQIEASELWLALTAIPRPHRLVPLPRNLPGTDVPVGDVAVWPLSQEEHHMSTVAADAEVRKLMKDLPKKDEASIGYQNLHANEIAVQQLWRALRDPKDVSKPLAPSPKALRLMLTADEIGVMYNHFLTAQAELGPIVVRLSEDEFEAWVRRLAEGGAAFPFDLLSWDLRTTLVRSMASRLVDFWTATSSAGSPLDDTTSTSPSERPSSDEPSGNSSSDAADEA